MLSVQCFIFKDNDYIFSSVLLQGSGYRVLAVYAVVVWMLSGDSWQT